MKLLNLFQSQLNNLNRKMKANDMLTQVKELLGMEVEAEKVL